MKEKDSWEYAVIGLALICLVLPAPASGQSPPAPPSGQGAPVSASGQAVPEKAFKQEVLDQLVAPIALHPDAVLTQILIASTYPLEVVQAERWVKQNKSLKGDAMTAALEKQPWDASVKALAPFPDVLTMMSEKLEWTQKLGDAFLAQQKDVMDTVQKLRRKASETGNLKTTKEQKVTVEPETKVVVIEPANPEVVYVPTYNPTVVYGTWPYPAYPPYPVYAYPPGAGLFAFSVGVAVGAAWHGGGYHNNWQGGTINIDNSVNINRPGTQPSGGGAKAQQWNHNPQHRQGVPYKDTASREKYSPTNRSAADNRQGSRGYDKPGASASDRSAGQSGPGQDRMSDRSGPQAKSSDNALGGMDRGGQAQRDSARGSQSMSSAKSSGGASGGASRGGGGRGGRR